MSRASAGPVSFSASAAFALLSLPLDSPELDAVAVACGLGDSAVDGADVHPASKLISVSPVAPNKATRVVREGVFSKGEL
ncbi:hypothetical protein HMPREF3160_06495 [Arthrobacter sp. HMSC06H05]|nr:hypothetical protein HMPREF3160_06495 [Arthrobacter sp. HMSC06H05]